jgi:serine/threonine protein kinase
MKVLISTLRDAPPILDPAQCSREYTSIFAQFIQLCLNKDPQMRPTAFELMKHPFITKAPPPEYLVNNIHMYNIKELQARSKEGTSNEFVRYPFDLHLHTSYTKTKFTEFREKKRQFDMMLLDPWEFPATQSLQTKEFFIHDKRDSLDEPSLVAITPPSTPPRSTSSSSSQFELSDSSIQEQRRRQRPMSENLSDRKFHVSSGTDNTTDDERYHVSRRGRFVVTSEVAFR